MVNLVGPWVPQSAPYYLAGIENNMCMLGHYAGVLLVQGLQKQGYKKANIMVIEGAETQPEVPVRMQCFDAVLAKYPQYKVVAAEDGNWDQGLSATEARTLFAKFSDKGGIQGAFGMADQQAAGIISSAEQAGLPVGVGKKNGLVVVASNCFKIGMEDIAKGLQYGTSTEAAEPDADFMLPLLERAIAGEKIPKLSLMTEAPITKANLSKWIGFCSAA